MHWRKAQVAVFTAYFDASGSEDDQIALVVAGFLSSAGDWTDFEKLWMERLGRDGIKYFHMVEFAQSRGQFEGWKGKEAERRSLLGDLLEIITSHVYRKFGCAILNKTWKSQVSEKHREEFMLNAYCLAGISTVSRVDHWALGEKIKTPVEIIFEDGDKGKGKLQTYLNRNRIPETHFRPKKDRMLDDGRIRPAVIPLQAADIMAYEAFVAFRNYIAGSDRVRYPIVELDGILGTIGYFEQDRLSNLDNMLRAIDLLIPIAEL